MLIAIDHGNKLVLPLAKFNPDDTPIILVISYLLINKLRIKD